MLRPTPTPGMTATLPYNGMSSNQSRVAISYAVDTVNNGSSTSGGTTNAGGSAPAAASRDRFPGAPNPHGFAMSYTPPGAPTPYDIQNPIQYYAAHQTNYSSDTGSYQNAAASSYRISDLHPDTQVYLQNLPADWLQNSSAEQLNGLVNELEEFHSNLYNTIAINHPTLELPSIVGAVVPPVLPKPTIVYDSVSTDAPTTGTVAPTPINNPPQAAQESNWYNNISLGGLTKAGGVIAGGVATINKFAPVIGDEVAEGTLGESLVTAIEGPVAETILEGVGAGAVEALGGVAAVGGFIAGGEVIAGVAAIGFGLYEGYQALGGTPIGAAVEKDISSTFTSAVSSFESFLHWP